MAGVDSGSEPLVVELCEGKAVIELQLAEHHMTDESSLASCFTNHDSQIVKASCQKMSFSRPMAEQWHVLDSIPHFPIESYTETAVNTRMQNTPSFNMIDNENTASP